MTDLEVSCVDRQSWIIGRLVQRVDRHVLVTVRFGKLTDCSLDSHRVLTDSSKPLADRARYLTIHGVLVYRSRVLTDM